MHESPLPFPERIRVGVAEATRMNSHLIADSLRRSRNNFEILACSGDSSTTFRELRGYRPHVALISAELEDGPVAGLKVLDQMRASEWKARVIILLDSDDRELVVGAFRAGARGVFCRRQSTSTLPKCIRTVHQGQIWVNNGELEFLLELMSNLKPMQIASPRVMTLLTRREQEVARLVAEGMRNREISAKLKLSEHTVRNYIFRMFEKLGLSTRVELVLYSLSHSEANQECIAASE